MSDFLAYCAAHPGVLVPDPVLNGLLHDFSCFCICYLCFAAGVSLAWLRIKLALTEEEYRLFMSWLRGGECQSN